MNFFPKLFRLDVSDVLSDSVDEKKMTLETSCRHERVNKLLSVNLLIKCCEDIIHEVYVSTDS